MRLGVHGGPLWFQSADPLDARPSRHDVRRKRLGHLRGGGISRASGAAVAKAEARAIMATGAAAAACVHLTGQRDMYMEFVEGRFCGPCPRPWP